MIDDLKDAIKKSQHHLADLMEKIEDQAESLTEDSVELWEETKPRLQAMKKSMAEAEQSLQTKTDEARLQAHLAIMDAHDQWSYLSKTMHELSHRARHKGQSELQHAELQAHLAKMEARDFINEKGGPIRQEFKQAREKVEETSLKALDELGKSLENTGNAWVHMP